ncbi:hypothetical protein [Dickeya zeae]|uniref:hypothetical protein n=1 Tax=Dickeya zeae TaxID=204042 RepID=UPI00037E728A|nr:hypothetical protein [Dickeya zeae]UJR52746.1 hypothetical protein J417_00885 [Dickeya zeae MS1]
MPNVFAQYTEKQPFGSEACGAFSLAALINARNAGPLNSPTGSNIYSEVIHKQSSLPVGYPPLFKGSDPRSLPSTLVALGIARGFACAQVTHTSAVPAALAPLISAEITLIGTTASVQEKETYKLQDLLGSNGYYLALVDGGNHWIAIVRDASGLYAYDPATGSSGTATVTGNDITGAVSHTFSGVLIHFAA